MDDYYHIVIIRTTLYDVITNGSLYRKRAGEGVSDPAIISLHRVSETNKGR
jgi:hypothetical protein